MSKKIEQYNPSAKNIVNDWKVVDASGQTLGILASKIATMLMGKHKPNYVPHMLTGDYVVVINVSGIKVTGMKSEQKLYTRHSQYPGNIKKDLLRFERKLSVWKTYNSIVPNVIKRTLTRTNGLICNYRSIEYC